MDKQTSLSEARAKRIQMLERGKPMRNQFNSDLEFQERLARWMSTSGRAIALHRANLTASQQLSKSTVKA